jgi:transposase
MSKTRREFSPEFKRETVALLESSGRPLMQVATEVGISPSMLRNWRLVVRSGSAIAGGVIGVAAAAVDGGPGVRDHAAEV